ncbi:MAG: glycosyl hydrolase [Acidimicrobiales bacterium]
MRERSPRTNVSIALRAIALTALVALVPAGCSSDREAPRSAATRTGSTAPRTASSTTVPAPAGGCVVGPKLVPTCGVLWGSYPYDAHADTSVATSAAERAAGRPFDLVHQYHDFSNAGSSGRFPTADETALMASGHVLHFGWSTSLWGRDPDHVSWRSIADGRHDDVIDAQAHRLVAMERAAPGREYFIDFDHEPDGRDDHGSPADYIAAARRVHDRLAAAGVTNAVWVWVIQNDVDGAAPFYPGDDVVDWIGYDPYNWVRCDDHRDPWLTFAETVTPTYDALERAAWHAPKPLMLAEYGTVEGARVDDKQRWLAGIPDALASLPHLRALEYFDDSDQTPGCDWALDSSPQATAGFATAGAALTPVGS